MTEPTHSGILKPEASATGTAIGVMSVIVPTEVPIAVDTKHATTNNTATANRGGIIDNIK